MDKPSRNLHTAVKANQHGWAVIICCLCLLLSERVPAQTNQPAPKTNSNPLITFEATKANAEKADAVAQNALGVMYATGNGVRQDCFQASRWFRKAAEQGDAQAQYHLALYFYDGERIDYKEAVVWYRKAADQRHAGAQNRLGIMLAEGKGVSQDSDEAIKWFREATEQGHADAKKNLVKTIQGKKATGSWQADAATLKIIQPQPPRRLPTIQSTNEITTTEGVTHKSVNVLKVEPDGLLVEYAMQGGGSGMATLKFENLSANLQQKYGYDPQKAVAYQTQQAAAQGQLRREMQAQHAQELAAARAIEADNFKGRLEIERLETERKQAEAARVRAEAERARIAKEEKEREAAREQAAIRKNQLTQEFIEQGYQIRDLWQNQYRSRY